MIWQLMAAAFIMLLISAVFIFWPRRQHQAANQTPAQLFEERLQLLALARDSGELAEQDFSAAAQELKSQFLQQKQQSLVLQQPGQKRLLQIILVIVTGVMVAGIYSMNGHYRQLDDWQTAREKLPEYGERALLNQGEALTDHEVSLFALALRTRLAEEGDDAVAWMLLGRIWMSQGMLIDAIEAFEQALRLTPNRTALLISYSQALIITGGDQNLAKAGGSVAKVLRNEPGNVDALSLMALIAYEKGDLAEARAAWQLLLDKLPPDDPRYTVVTEKLTELAQSDTDSNDTAAARQVVVNLTVDPALRQQHPEASLFVFARVAGGPPLPLSVQRMPLPAGAVQIVLTEKMAMQPGWTLAEAEQIEVVARMSQAGTVEQREGDLQVVSEVLSFTVPEITTHLTLEF
ncbi:c-type cytochrome biogenesis protein CcmI [Chromatiaceae bacterium AAb-1]|nr:c-type cytochrome biogenesis protein CcmI [Chromatiaceae bacterium AAb-1]